MAILYIKVPSGTLTKRLCVSYSRVSVYLIKFYGRFRIFSKRRPLGWWIPVLSFGNMKSGYKKDTLLHLLTNFPKFNPEDTPEIDDRPTENTASPH